jgi:hypothetical protein
MPLCPRCCCTFRFLKDLYVTCCNLNSRHTIIYFISTLEIFQLLARYFVWSPHCFPLTQIVLLITAEYLHTYVHTGSRGWIPGRGKRFFLLRNVQTGSGAQPASYTRAPGAPSSGIRRLGREADRSSPPSVEVKNGGAIPPLPHVSSWSGAYLMKLMDNFAFYLYHIFIYQAFQPYTERRLRCFHLWNLQTYYICITDDRHGCGPQRHDVHRVPRKTIQ